MYILNIHVFTFAIVPDRENQEADILSALFKEKPGKKNGREAHSVLHPVGIRAGWVCVRARPTNKKASRMRPGLQRPGSGGRI
ncbi:MAG: hypothetical protein WBW61_05630 [Rhodanobacteraceae bacterium]